MIGNELFALDTYDCIGFDLDNTLVQYAEFELVSLTYSCIAAYMVKHYSYPNDILEPITSHIDFIRKGLTLDAERGNVLSLGSDGTVLRASHGLRLLTACEIEQIYKPNGKWDVAAKHCNDFLYTWNGELSQKIRSSLDYFDMCVPLLFARLVDFIDKSTEIPTKYDVWSQIFEAVMYIYRTESFANNTGEYYRPVKENPSKYLKKCSSKFIDWLESVKLAGKITFLITGSKDDYGNFTSEYVLCKNWNKYFDVIIYYAKKPGFFFQNRPFLSCESGNLIHPSELKLNSSYEGGNWSDLYRLFSKETCKNNPKCVYIGDNLIQDIYTPAEYHCCDTVAIVRELSIEFDKNELFHSETWGSFFYDEKRKMPTVWGTLIKNYAKICIPSVEWFVDQSLRKEYNQLKKLIFKN